jgi:hypothetical protein
MERNQYKTKQREILANMIQKIKIENGIDINSNINNNIYEKRSKKKEKSKKKHKKKNLNLNDNLNKEIQDINPQNKNNTNYEKSKYI